MAVSATRFASPLAALLLGCTALGGTAHAGWFDSDKSGTSAKDDKGSVIKSDTVQPAETLDGSIRQAQLLRLSGNYPEAIKHLSQLMMLAADDSRVVSEYGKTLASMGRAQDAVNFLTRAQQLQPNDWTNYSAMGVAYDQLGNQKDAQAAYERALILKPDEPSVLNNYALSRMLAKDPEGARKLVARAESAGGVSDPMIARTIAMIKDMTPPTNIAATTTPSPVARTIPAQQVTQPTIQIAPLTPVAVASTPKSVLSPQAITRNQPPAATDASAVTGTPTAAGAPRPLMPANNNQIPPQTPRGVVMQAVPVDPLAGPAAKPHPTPIAAATIVKAGTKTPELSPTKIISQAKNNAKPDAAPKPVAPATPVKVAVKTDFNSKTDAKPKDAVPALRMSANAY